MRYELTDHEWAAIKPNYANRHFHRSVPGVQRVQRWRRQLLLDPAPFAPILERTAHYRLSPCRADQGRGITATRALAVAVTRP